MSSEGTVDPIEQLPRCDLVSVAVGVCLDEAMEEGDGVLNLRVVSRFGAVRGVARVDRWQEASEFECGRVAEPSLASDDGVEVFLQRVDVVIARVRVSVGGEREGETTQLLEPDDG